MSMSDTELSSVVKDLTEQVVELDKVVTKLTLSMDSHIREERAMEQTLRNIDDSLNALTLQFAASPMERHKEVEIIVHPIQEKLRVLEDKIIEINAATEKRVKANAMNYLTIVILFTTMVFSVAGYAYFNDKHNLLDKIKNTKELLIMDIKSNSEDIDVNTKRIDSHYRDIK